MIIYLIHNILSTCKVLLILGISKRIVIAKFREVIIFFRQNWLIYSPIDGFVGN